MMDIQTIRGIGTAVVFIAFIGLVLWAYSSKRKSSFDDAANLPFVEALKTSVPDEQSSRSNKQ